MNNIIHGMCMIKLTDLDILRNVTLRYVTLRYVMLCMFACVRVNEHIYKRVCACI